MATELRRFTLRRGTAAAWLQANPILEDGEEGYESDTQKRKVGNGVDPWQVLEYDQGAPGPQGSPGPKGDAGPPGTIPATGIPARALYVESSGVYPPISLNSYKEFMGVGTPPADKTLTGDIWTKLQVAPAATKIATSNGRSVSSATNYDYTIPAGAAGPAAGQMVIVSVMVHTNAPATWVATITGRTIAPIMPVYGVSGLATAVYVFKADASTAGAVFSVALTNPTGTVAAQQATFMTTWFTGLKGSGAQGNAVNAVRTNATTSAIKTSPTVVTTVPNVVEFGIALSVDSTAPVATHVNLTTPLIEQNEQYITTAPSPLQALGAILTPVQLGSTIGGRTFTFAQADETTPTGPYGVAYAFGIEADSAAAPTRLIWTGSEWALLDGNV